MPSTFISKVVLQWLLLWQIQSFNIYPKDGHFLVAEAQIQPIVKQAKDTVAEALEPFRQQYTTLSPKGKFVTGAMCGLASSKIVVRTSMKALKYSGAVVIICKFLFISMKSTFKKRDDF